MSSTALSRIRRSPTLAFTLAPVPRLALDGMLFEIEAVAGAARLIFRARDSEPVK
ncbi:hypothetical protein GIW54_14020 [Pseudomonas proteolytica]|uniref:Uncharacterized protein n=1 Tax=Pseudomonas proteolytica TaxID=219574 RepID=A0AAW5A7Q2_9PSED|nr:hypothetical protein [Pseudomonas proteolytica]MCF5101866.1 hypothetical protein [Pseudomonas proteolytica]